MKKILLISLFSVISMIPVHANNAWYVGQVSRISLSNPDGSFFITFKNNVANDCKYKYVRFSTTNLGEEKVKNAYAMALTSITSGIQMGVVIDIDANGVGGNCYATGSVADLRAN